MPGCLHLTQITEEFNSTVKKFMDGKNSFLVKDLTPIGENGKIAILKIESLTVDNLLDALALQEYSNLEYETVVYNSMTEHINLTWKYFQKVYKVYLKLLRKYGDDLLSAALE